MSVPEYSVLAVHSTTSSSVLELVLIRGRAYVTPAHARVEEIDSVAALARLAESLSTSVTSPRCSIIAPRDRAEVGFDAWFAAASRSLAAAERRNARLLAAAHAAARRIDA